MRNEFPERKYPEDAPEDPPIKIPDTEPGKDNPRNPQENTDNFRW